MSKEIEKDSVLYDGKLKEVTLKIGGKRFICPITDCKCNIFYQPDKSDLTKYKCAGCMTEFVCEGINNVI